MKDIQYNITIILTDVNKTVSNYTTRFKVFKAFESNLGRSKKVKKVKNKKIVGSYFDMAL